ncbi:hypothetical protein AGMMS50268_14860 [Spirochaetia bacterium]|nr:hypothetical protein AGMMS50268_14860 [Spirochaetia bacterium]
MGKLIDFYRLAKTDEGLRQDLEASNKRLADKKDVSKDSVIAEVIRIAGEHGVVLERADFEGKAEELDTAELSAVAGGTISVCVVPGNDGHMPKPGDYRNSGIPREPPCTSFGRNPHPTFGISIKIS